MDPLSITVASTSLIGLCYTLTAFLYTSIQGVKGIDASIQALCSEVNSLAQTLQAIQEIWTNNPLVAEAQTRDNTTLWINIKKTLEDCQVGLEKLDGLCKKSKGKSSAGNSFFRRSIKQVKFSLSAGEIASSRLHIQAYNGAISIALQTFNMYDASFSARYPKLCTKHYCLVLSFADGCHEAPLPYMEEKTKRICMLKLHSNSQTSRTKSDA
jgi:hypothetical protein